MQMGTCENTCMATIFTGFCQGKVAMYSKFIYVFMCIVTYTYYITIAIYIAVYISSATIYLSVVLKSN